MKRNVNNIKKPLELYLKDSCEESHTCNLSNISSPYNLSISDWTNGSISHGLDEVIYPVLILTLDSRVRNDNDISSCIRVDDQESLDHTLNWIHQYYVSDVLEQA